MMVRYRSQSAAFQRVGALVKERGRWPGVVTKHDAKGAYYVLTYDEQLRYDRKDHSEANQSAPADADLGCADGLPDAEAGWSY